MENYEEVKDNLRVAALKVKYILLILGILPIFFIVLELILSWLITSESLQSVRSVPNKGAILIVLALVAVLSVTFEPWFIYRMILRGLKGPPVNLSVMIIIRPCIATTPAILGFILFFIFNIYVSLAFQLLSLIYIWRFNLKIESFLDRMAEDISELVEI